MLSGFPSPKKSLKYDDKTWLIECFNIKVTEPLYFSPLTFACLFFKTGFLCVDPDVLELTLYTRLTLNSEI